MSAPAFRWAPWLAMAGAGLLCLPQARAALEASMTRHMLVQIPLLALIGFMLAASWPASWRAHLQRWNAHGIAGFFGIALLMALLMIPRLLDLAVADWRIDAAKGLALLLGGVALNLSWRPAGLLVQGFFLGNVLPMMAAVGQLYQDSPVRLCNAYLLDDQLRLGQALVGLSVAIALAWFANLLRMMIRTEAAIAPECVSQPAQADATDPVSGAGCRLLRLSPGSAAHGNR
jgi:hypothetical protein